MKKRLLCTLCLTCCMALILGCEKVLDDPPPENASLTGAQDDGTGTPASTGGSNQFVWKPISEGDGNLVVLLPSSFAGRVDSVQVRQGGSTLESGRFTGNTNGNRPTFRFSKPGSGYGNGLTVVANLTGGGNATWDIPSGGTRVD